jgi:hypothetical protein
MKDQYRILIILLLSLGYMSNCAYAQDTIRDVRHHGKLDSIYSRILNQQRLIQVFVPSAYKAGSNDKYDVL